MPRTSLATQPQYTETRLRPRSSEPPQKEVVSKLEPITMEKVLEGIRDLPALPSVMVKVLRVTSNGENVSPREVAAIIAQDPNFSARMLRMANSAYYGLPRSVSTLSDAVLMLGNCSIRNVAMLAASSDTLNQKVVGYELRPGELWRHSIMCATASQLLAEHSLYNDREVAFVGGLLHDVGKIVLGSYVAERLPIIQAYCLKYGSSFVEAERAVMGFDHAEVGGRIAAQWNLPSPLVNAITYHHNPIQNGSINPFIALIYLGNRLCFSTPSEVLDSLADEGNAQCMEALRLTPQHISNVLQQLGEQMDKVPLLTME